MSKEERFQALIKYHNIQESWIDDAVKKIMRIRFNTYGSFHSQVPHFPTTDAIANKNGELEVGEEWKSCGEKYIQELMNSMLISPRHNIGISYDYSEDLKTVEDFVRTLIFSWLSMSPSEDITEESIVSFLKRDVRLIPIDSLGHANWTYEYNIQCLLHESRIDNRSNEECHNKGVQLENKDNHHSGCSSKVKIGCHEQSNSPSHICRTTSNLSQFSCSSPTHETRRGTKQKIIDPLDEYSPNERDKDNVVLLDAPNRDDDRNIEMYPLQSDSCFSVGHTYESSYYNNEEEDSLYSPVSSKCSHDCDDEYNNGNKCGDVNVHEADHHYIGDAVKTKQHVMDANICTHHGCSPIRFKVRFFRELQIRMSHITENQWEEILGSVKFKIWLTKSFLDVYMPKLKQLQQETIYLRKKQEMNDAVESYKSTTCREDLIHEIAEKALTYSVKYCIQFIMDLKDDRNQSVPNSMSNTQERDTSWKNQRSKKRKQHIKNDDDNNDDDDGDVELQTKQTCNSDDDYDGHNIYQKGEDEEKVKSLMEVPIRKCIKRSKKSGKNEFLLKKKKKKKDMSMSASNRNTKNKNKKAAAVEMHYEKKKPKQKGQFTSVLQEETELFKEKETNLKKRLNNKNSYKRKQRNDISVKDIDFKNKEQCSNKRTRIEKRDNDTKMDHRGSKESETNSFLSPNVTSMYTPVNTNVKLGCYTYCLSQLAMLLNIIKLVALTSIQKGDPNEETFDSSTVDITKRQLNGIDGLVTNPITNKCYMILMGYCWNKEKSGDVKLQVSQETENETKENKNEFDWLDEVLDINQRKEIENLMNTHLRIMQVCYFTFFKCARGAQLFREKTAEFEKSCISNENKKQGEYNHIIDASQLKKGMGSLTMREIRKLNKIHKKKYGKATLSKKKPKEQASTGKHKKNDLHPEIVHEYLMKQYTKQKRKEFLIESLAEESFLQFSFPSFVEKVTKVLNASALHQIESQMNINGRNMETKNASPSIHVSEDGEKESEQGLIKDSDRTDVPINKCSMNKTMIRSHYDQMIIQLYELFWEQRHNIDLSLFVSVEKAKKFQCLHSDPSSEKCNTLQTKVDADLNAIRQEEDKDEEEKKEEYVPTTVSVPSDIFQYMYSLVSEYLKSNVSSNSLNQ